jgi:hypothetical protein
MINPAESASQGDDRHDDDHPQIGPDITIIINNKSFTIHRGHQTVIAIKTLGGVPLADDLEELVDGTLKLLPDDGAVTIKGGEVFISHPKDSGSSSW